MVQITIWYTHVITFRVRIGAPRSTRFLIISYCFISLSMTLHTVMIHDSHTYPPSKLDPTFGHLMYDSY